MRCRIAAAVAAGMLTLALAACNGDTTDGTGDGDDAATGDVEVEVLDDSFSPADVEVAVGDTVA